MAVQLRVHGNALRQLQGMSKSNQAKVIGFLRYLSGLPKARDMGGRFAGVVGVNNFQFWVIELDNMRLEFGLYQQKPWTTLLLRIGYRKCGGVDLTKDDATERILIPLPQTHGLIKLD